MKPSIAVATAITASFMLLTGCSTSGPETDPGVVFHFDFGEGRQGWESLFSNYDVGREEGLELEAGHRTLPEPLDTMKKALYISGENHSDDLNMFFKRRVSGLEPNTTYSVAFEVEIATNAPSGCVGVGGAPGESVTMHAAASASEPERVVDEDPSPYYRLNLVVDYGRHNWYRDTEIGDIANSLRCEEAHRLGSPYRRKRIESDPGHWQVQTDAEGSAWLLVGTRSGFESTTSLYYTEITARF